MNPVWLVMLIICASAAVYALIAFFALGIFDARDNDPPLSDRIFPTDADKRLAARKEVREWKAVAWLPLLLWHLALHRIARGLLWVGRRIWGLLQSIRRLGGAFAKRKPEGEPHLGPEVKDGKAELPQARVVR